MIPVGRPWAARLARSLRQQAGARAALGGPGGRGPGGGGPGRALKPRAPPGGRTQRHPGRSPSALGGALGARLPPGAAEPARPPLGLRLTRPGFRPPGAVLRAPALRGAWWARSRAGPQGRSYSRRRPARGAAPASAGPGTSAGPSVGPGHLERFQVGARSGSCNVHTPGDAGRSGADPGCPASRVRRRRRPGARVLRAPPGAWRARALSASPVRRDALALAGRACDHGSRSLRRRRSELLPTSHLRGTPGEHLPARSMSLFRSSRFRGDSDTPSQTPGWG